ncbi:MAG: alpha/beta fold hydrolase, partial [Acidobacteriota bacterium]
LRRRRRATPPQCHPRRGGERRDPVVKLLLLHGFGGRGAVWRPLIDALPDGLPAGGALVVDAPDLPGHGGAHETAEALPDDFEATVDRIAADHLPSTEGPVHTVGYSLGARLALGLALRHPDAVASLTLVGVRPGLDATDRCPRRELDRRRAEALRADLPAFFEGWSRLPLFESQRRLDPEILEVQRRIRRGHSPDGLAWAIETLSPGHMPDYRNRLGELEVPVHWVTGELDAPFLAVAEGVRVSHPDFRFFTAPDSGHNVPLEAPAVLASYLAERVLNAGAEHSR